MPFIQCHFRSNVLTKHAQCWVLTPSVGKPPYPTFYLLHGLSDDHTIWMRRTRIEVYAEKYPITIVMPDGYRGFYTDNEEGPAYARYIAEDVLGFTERTFQVKTTGKARAIGGLSMGGYGALRIALAHPQLFTSCTSHSGALMRGAITYTKPEQAEMRRVFGRRPAGTSHDLVHLARQAQAAGKVPKLRIDCGTEDFLLDENRRYTEALGELGIDHQYEEFPGAHTWEYWDLHIQQALAFHAKALGVKPA